MTVTVADGITWVEGSRTNFYVVEDGDTVCLVDTGYPGDFKLLTAALERLGRTPSDVSAVLLTHGHVDHLGSAERMRRESGARVHTHEMEAAHVRGEVEERISNAYMISRLWWPKMWSFLRNVMAAKALKLEHVQDVFTFGTALGPLDLPGGPVPVFTPGHTSGHCGYHFPDRGALITGDALVTHDSLTGAKGPRLLNSAFNHRHDQAATSLEQFRPLQADIVLPGHGPPFRGSPASAVDQALRA